MTEAEWLEGRIPSEMQDALLGKTSDRKLRLLDAACAYYPAQWTMQSVLMREILGNPFRPINVDQTWLTPDVLAIALGIYEDRAFNRMPILADALQDAGCDNDYLLNHCRGPGPHVQGCWVVDAILGKA